MTGSDLDEARPPFAFAARMALIYSVFFAYTGLFLPYFPLWLKERGLDSGQIGIVLSLPLLVRILTSGQISAFADRTADRANVLIVLCAGSAVCVAVYPLVAGFWPILAIALTMAVFNHPIQPVVDSITLSGVRRFGVDYGRIRLWGSVVFIGANLVGGALLGGAGIGAVMTVMIATAIAGALLSPVTPRLGRPRRPATALEIASAGAWRLMANRRFMLMTAGCGLIQATHAFVYTFGSIHWQNVGYSGDAIGAFWAVGVAAEVLLFQFSRRVLGRLSPVPLAALGAAAAILRWALLPFAPDVATVALLQALHGLSFGATHLGLMHFYNDAVPEERIGAAQGVGFVVGAAFMGLAIFASGPLFAMAGGYGFLAMALASAAGLGLLVLAMRSPAQPQSAVDGGETSALE